MTQTIHIIGRIGKEPIIREWDGKKVANFSVATSDTFKDRSTGEKREEVQWHKCVLWQHDNLIPFLQQGILIYVKGQLKYGSFDKVINGENFSIPTAEVICEEVVLLASNKSETN